MTSGPPVRLREPVRPREPDDPLDCLTTMDVLWLDRMEDVLPYHLRVDGSSRWRRIRPHRSWITTQTVR